MIRERLTRKLSIDKKYLAGVRLFSIVSNNFIITPFSALMSDGFPMRGYMIDSINSQVGSLRTSPVEKMIRSFKKGFFSFIMP